MTAGAEAGANNCLIGENCQQIPESAGAVGGVGLRNQRSAQPASVSSGSGWAKAVSDGLKVTHVIYGGVVDAADGR